MDVGDVGPVRPHEVAYPAGGREAPRRADHVAGGGQVAGRVLLAMLDDRVAGIAQQGGLIRGDGVLASGLAVLRMDLEDLHELAV